jgi:hypothetical protein
MMIVAILGGASYGHGMGFCTVFDFEEKTVPLFDFIVHVETHFGECLTHIASFWTSMNLKEFFFWEEYRLLLSITTDLMNTPPITSEVNNLLRVVSPQALNY